MTASLQLYESLRPVGDPDDATLRHVLGEHIDGAVPFLEARAFDRHRRALSAAVLRALDGGSLEASTADVGRYVDRMMALATVDVERLDRRETGAAWSPLSLLWTLISLANALLVLEYKRRRSRGRDRGRDDDERDNGEGGIDGDSGGGGDSFAQRALRSVPSRSEWLRAAGLIVVGGGRRVSRYTASELVSAVYVVRSRLDVLQSLDVTLLEYVRALEMRAGTLIALALPGSVHDSEQWRRRVALADTSLAASLATPPSDPSSANEASNAQSQSRAQSAQSQAQGAQARTSAQNAQADEDDDELYVASREFVAASAHWFVALRQALANYRLITSPTYFGGGGGPDAPPRVYPTRALRVRSTSILARVESFARERSTAYSDEAHTDGWISLAAKYSAAPGSVAAACAVRTDGERVQWRNALGVEHSTAAADYAASAKFRERTVAHYIDELFARVHRNEDDRPTIGDEAFFESLALLQVWRVYIRSNAPRLAEWPQWFLLMARDADTYHRRVAAAVDARLPVIVQTLGRFAVLVPRPPDDYRAALDASGAYRGVDAAVALERQVFALLEIDANEVNDGEPLVADAYARATLYETPNALHALIVWLAALLVGWAGRVHRDRSLAPIARYLLALDDGGRRALEAPADARIVACDV